MNNEVSSGTRKVCLPFYQHTSTIKKFVLFNLAKKSSENSSILQVVKVKWCMYEYFYLIQLAWLIAPARGHCEHSSKIANLLLVRENALYSNTQWRMKKVGHLFIPLHPLILRMLSRRAKKTFFLPEDWHDR